MSEIKEIPTELKEEEEISETPPEPAPQEDVPPPAPPLKRAKTQQEEEPEEQIPEPEEEIPEPKKKAKAKAAKAKPKGRPKGAVSKVKQVSVSKEPPEIRSIPAATPPHEEEDLSVMLFKMIRQQDELTRQRKRRLYASWFE